jgi:hypothetical protein
MARSEMFVNGQSENSEDFKEHPEKEDAEA